MNVLLLGLLAFSSWTALQAQNPNTGTPPREAEEAKEAPAKTREAEPDPPALDPRIKQPDVKEGAKNPVENAAAESLFQRGVQAYGAENYEAAIDFLEKAVQAAPGVSRYHDWLGKAYGRRAERVIFIRAIVLARKARNEFARAAELDPTNIEAWSDLLDYDLQAPGFLGGGLDRAKAVAAKLATLNAAEGHRAQALIRAAEKDHAGAEREYRAALALEPATGTPRQTRYLIRLRSWRRTRPITCSREASNWSPQSEIPSGPASCCKPICARTASRKIRPLRRRKGC
jgi:tetratricopeptide (TPR) repeat protein